MDLTARLSADISGVKSGVSSAKKELESFKSVAKDTAKVSDAQAQAINKSMQSLKRLASSGGDARVAMAEMKKEIQGLSLHLNSLGNTSLGQGVKASILEASQAINDMKAKVQDAQTSMTMMGATGFNMTRANLELKQLTNELTNLTIAYRAMSAEEQNSAEGRAMMSKMTQLRNEAGALKDTIVDVRQEIQNMSSDTLNFDALTEVVGISANAMSTYSSIVAMVTDDEDDLKQAMAVAMTVQQGLNTLTLIGNTINSSSAAIAKIRALQEAGLAKGLKGTTIAQRAFNLACKANPYVLLATAIVTVIGALIAFSGNLSDAREEAKKEGEEIKRLKAIHDAQKKSMDDINKSAFTQVGKFKALQVAFSKCRTEGEKQRFLKNYSSNIKSLGLNVKNSAEAFDVFVRNSDKYIKAIGDVAIASEASKQYAELYVQKAMYDAKQDSFKPQRNPTFYKAVDAARWANAYGLDLAKVPQTNKMFRDGRTYMPTDAQYSQMLRKAGNATAHNKQNYANSLQGKLSILEGLMARGMNNNLPYMNDNSGSSTHKYTKTEDKGEPLRMSSNIGSYEYWKDVVDATENALKTGFKVYLEYYKGTESKNYKDKHSIGDFELDTSGNPIPLAEEDRALLREQRDNAKKQVELQERQVNPSSLLDSTLPLTYVKAEPVSDETSPTLPLSGLKPFEPSLTDYSNVDNRIAYLEQGMEAFDEGITKINEKIKENAEKARKLQDTLDAVGDAQLSNAEQEKVNQHELAIARNNAENYALALAKERLKLSKEDYEHDRDKALLKTEGTRVKAERYYDEDKHMNRWRLAPKYNKSQEAWNQYYKDDSARQNTFEGLGVLQGAMEKTVNNLKHSFEEWYSNPDNRANMQNMLPEDYAKLSAEELVTKFENAQSRLINGGEVTANDAIITNAFVGLVPDAEKLIHTMDDYYSKNEEYKGTKKQAELSYRKANSITAHRDYNNALFEGAKGGLDAMEGFEKSLSSIYSTWKNLSESMSEGGFEAFIAGWEAVITTLKAVSDAINAVQAIIQIVDAITSASAKKKVADGNLEIAMQGEKLAATTATNGALVAQNALLGASTGALALVQAVASASNVPFPGTIPAMAANLASASSMLAQASSTGAILGAFAEGGIIKGATSVGDYNLARVNGGEMILNGTQQARLFSVLNGTRNLNSEPSTQGKVKFEIKGTRLVGVLSNQQKKQSRL